MNKKSKVTNVQASGTWEGKFGLMYKFEVEFDNGDAGEYSSKSKDQTKFVVGQETDYEYIDGKFPKVKPVWTQQGQIPASTKTNYNTSNDSKRQDLICKQSSLKSAVEYDNTCSIEKVIENAQIFYEWVVNDKYPSVMNKDEYPF